ncbi:hypothetical protein C5167_043244 [Papaver somniferum]|uniref:Checkpoint protein n=1 Tax=Papaver somniferum TaxID=3469 RepID=A0A4Y7L558_PAPSO|nr:hypothetical protein C5167_043244 [Papaver somniferum]
MKFKAFLTDNGVTLLEKRFFPALDKMGRICHLYLTKDYAIFLHNLLNGDGVQSIAQFRKEALFDDYRISSQNEDRIAFTVDLALLQRALRSSISISSTTTTTTVTDRLQIKLVKKLPPNSQQPMPFLSFESKSAVVQEWAKPLSRADLLELQTALDMAQDLPQTLVRVPDLGQLQSFVDRLKHVGDLLNISVAQYGDLHLQVSTTLISLGQEFRKLQVVGVQAEEPPSYRDMSAQSRTEMAVQRGEAMSVFFIPGTRHNDNSISLHCRLPVLDPGSG